MLVDHKRFALIVLISLLLVALGLYIARLRIIVANQFLIDDAFIYLRFARNAARGLGLVWNSGEAPVEGFTSFLYMILLVLAEKLAIPLIFWMPILSVVCSLIALALSWRLGQTLNPGHTLENLMALILIVFCPTFVYWSANGMEMPFYTVLLLLAVLSYLRQKTSAWWVGGLFAIASLTRPESLLLFVATVVFDVIFKWMDSKKPVNRATLFMVFAFMMIYVPVLVWRFAYFGYPFPNTYYAKTGTFGSIQLTGGLKYLVKNLYDLFPGFGIPLLLLLTRVHKIKWDPKFQVARLYVTVLLLVSFTITVINGGDHFAFGRFMMPAIPLLFVIISVGFSAFLNHQFPGNAIKTVAVLTTVLIAVYYWRPWLFVSAQELKTDVRPANSSTFQYFEDWNAGYITMGKSLRTEMLENESIALVPIGAIGYYSEMNIIDMVGLVDPIIAHEPFDPAYTATWDPGHDKGNGFYILSKRPDYIQFIDRLTSQPLEGLDADARLFKSKVEIWASPEFHAQYEFHPIQTTGGWYYNLYRRID